MRTTTTKTTTPTTTSTITTTVSRRIRQRPQMSRFGRRSISGHVPAARCRSRQSTGQETVRAATTGEYYHAVKHTTSHNKATTLSSPCARCRHGDCSAARGAKSPDHGTQGVLYRGGDGGQCDHGIYGHLHRDLAVHNFDVGQLFEIRRTAEDAHPHVQRRRYHSSVAGGQRQRHHLI